MKNRKSIHDLAGELKISAATVSYVLNGKSREKRISRTLEERVLKYANDVGYQPSMIAKCLRTGKSNIIGVLVEDISDPFFAAIARFLEVEAIGSGYRLFFLSTENEPSKAKSLIKILRDRKAGGFIIAPPPNIEEEILGLQNDNIPVVLLDRYLPSIDTDNVIVDNFEGAYNAIGHLLGNGFKKIGFVTLDPVQTQMVARLEGYKSRMVESGLPATVETIGHSLAGRMISEKVLCFVKNNKDLDAILFATNYLTVSGLRALKEIGFKPQGDMAGVSFDDNIYFNLYDPAITAVEQPIAQMSRAALQRLMQCMANPEKNGHKETIVLKTRLIVRDSSKRKAQESMRGKGPKLSRSEAPPVPVRSVLHQLV